MAFFHVSTKIDDGIKKRSLIKCYQNLWQSGLEQMVKDDALEAKELLGQSSTMVGAQQQVEENADIQYDDYDSEGT